MSISLQCEFWAVGQGLFSSGKVLSGGNTAFSWVYDCGTSSDQKTLQCAIQEMKKDYPESELDLLVISHFDKDHINGIGNLLAQYQSVKRIMLPYYPLWQRMLIAFLENVSFTAEDDELQIYLDPVKYIATHYEKHLNNSEVLLVPAYQSEGEIKTLQDGIAFENELPLEYQDFSHNNIKIKLLKANSAFQHSTVEFVAYNEPFLSLIKPSINLHTLQTQVENILSSGLSASAIASLKQLYERVFGHLSKQKNQISLYLYVQPLFTPAFFNEVKYFQQQSPYTIQINHIYNLNWDRPKKAIFYTGDGFLDNQTKFDLLKRALGHKRLQNIFCLQVMHHGSDKNCFIGLADQIKPCISVFCADEKRKNTKHPSPSVVKEFLPYNPILVNKITTLKIK